MCFYDYLYFNLVLNLRTFHRRDDVKESRDSMGQGRHLAQPCQHRTGKPGQDGHDRPAVMGKLEIRDDIPDRTASIIVIGQSWAGHPG